VIISVDAIPLIIQPFTTTGFSVFSTICLELTASSVTVLLNQNLKTFLFTRAVTEY